MTNPVYQSILTTICQSLGVQSLDRVEDSDIAQQAHRIALGTAVQIQMLSAASLWTSAKRDDREALGGSMSMDLHPSGRFGLNEPDES